MLAPTGDIIYKHTSRSAKRTRVVSLFFIWGSSGIAVVTCFIILYTAFLGRYKVQLNETPYAGYYYTCEPGSLWIVSNEGYGITHCGQDGLVVNKALKADTQKLLFIGDSYVGATEVSDLYKFTEVIERSWNLKHPTLPIQTLNLGRGGQDMRAYLSFSQNMDQHFQPDRVFVMLTSVDFDNLANAPDQLAKVSQGIIEPIIKPNDHLSASGRVINQLGIQAFVSRIIRQGYGFGGCSETPDLTCLKSAFAAFQLWKQPHFQEEAEHKANSPDTTQVSGAGEDGKRAAIVIQLRALQAIWGERLVIIYHGGIGGLGMGDPPPAAADQIILDEIVALKIPTVNLYPSLWSAYQQHRPPAGFANSRLGSGHYNWYGHQLIADAVSAYLETRP